MATLLERYNHHNARLRASGTVLVAFSCPCCAGEIETLPASAGEVWDTMSQCPHCEGVFWKITRGGEVATEAYRKRRNPQ